MTTKQQAKDLVDLNASSSQIERLTGCHPECVEYIRAWGRSERVETSCLGGWLPLERAGMTVGDHIFRDPRLYRIVPKRITATATLEDGRVVEVEFPAPVREPLEVGEAYWLAYGDEAPVEHEWRAGYEHRVWLAQGRIFRTREDAIEHDRAMIRLRGGEVE